MTEKHIIELRTGIAKQQQLLEKQVSNRNLYDFELFKKSGRKKKQTLKI